MKTLLATGQFENSNFEIYRESGRLFFDPGNSARVDLNENKAVLALLLKIKALEDILYAPMDGRIDGITPEMYKSLGMVPRPK